jgi:PBP1b-binding outer membrane lipoprotein LpoB
MKYALITLLLCANLLSGCSSSNNDDDVPAAGEPTVTSTAFDDLVVDMIENKTSATAAPVEINALTITFSEEEGQFDEVLDN